MNKSIALLLLLGVLCISTKAADCCENKYWLFSFDRSFWMTNVHPIFDAMMDNNAFILDQDRRWQDHYMGAHQFHLNSNVPMSRNIPYLWTWWNLNLVPPVFPPTSWPDVLINLNEPLIYLTNQINLYKDRSHFKFYLFVGQNPWFTIQPSNFVLNNLANAIQNTNCQVQIQVIYIQWWLFNRRRNLQISGEDLRDLFNRPGFGPSEPVNPRRIPEDPNSQSQADVEQRAKQIAQSFSQPSAFREGAGAGARQSQRLAPINPSSFQQYAKSTSAPRQLQQKLKSALSSGRSVFEGGRSSSQAVINVRTVSNANQLSSIVENVIQKENNSRRFKFNRRG